MKLKFSVNKKIKNSREEEKVLERMGQSDFGNTQRILLLLRSRAEFRSRLSLSVDEELDWIFFNESSDVGSGDAMDAIGTSDLEMIRNLNQNILEMINNLNQNILSTLLDLSMVENGQMENVNGQSVVLTSGLQEIVTPPLPHIYPVLPPLQLPPCPDTPLAVSTMPTALTENGQMENVTGQTGASTSGLQETGFTQPLPHIYPVMPPLQLRPFPGTPPAVSTIPPAPLPPQSNHFCAPIAPLPSLYNISKATLLRLNRTFTSTKIRPTIRFWLKSKIIIQSGQVLSLRSEGAENV